MPSLALLTTLAAAVSGHATTTRAVYAVDPDSAPPRRIVMHAPVEVPLLRASERDSRAQVEVMVNGQGPFRFDVETGSRHIDISPALATRLGLKRIGTTSADMPQYHVDSINVGEASFQDFPVGEYPAGINGVDGVLGLPFYQNLLLVIDYPAHKLRFSRDTLPAANGRDILALTRVSDFWGVPLQFGEHHFTGVLDTQNSGVLNVPPAIADQLSFDGGLQVIGRGRGAFGVVEIKGGKLTSDVQLGGYTLQRPFLDVVQLPPDYPNQPNIGSRLLDQFRVSLDQRHARLRLEHDGGVLTLPEPQRGPPRGGRGGLAVSPAQLPSAASRYY
jgi:aspartyl protease